MKHAQSKRKTKIITYILIVALMAVGGLAFYANRKTPNNSPATSENSQKTQPISKQSKVSSEDQALKNLVKGWTANHSGDYGISIREINNSQRTALYQPDKQFIAASTFKLFLIYASLHQVEAGAFNLNTSFANGPTVAKCIDSLVIISSDACAWSFGNLTGWAKINDFLHDNDFANTNINNYDSSGGYVGDKYSTATDEAEIAWRLANGSLLNQEHTDLLLGKMKAQVLRERIPAGVPNGVAVADKPGYIYDIQNDTGIVYGPKSTYVLAIMSKDSSPTNLADLSKVIYSYLNSAN